MRQGSEQLPSNCVGQPTTAGGGSGVAQLSTPCRQHEASVPRNPRCACRASPQWGARPPLALLELPRRACNVPKTKKHEVRTGGWAARSNGAPVKLL